MSERTQPTDQPTAPVTDSRLSRRRALTGVAGVGIGVPLLAACGGEDSAVDPQAATSQTPATAGGSAAGETAEPASAFASTADVPVGGGAVFPDEGVVVTQPSDGEFLGFSITCPHQGCPVDRVTEEGIVCPCHGSVFDLSSGEPTAGPAQSPLGAVQLRIQGTDITRA